MLNSTTPTICFSISHVLAVPFDSRVAELLLPHGMVATASKVQQFILPGVVELMQLLFETENIKVAFFSSEEEQKTKAFVEMLLSYALGPDRYEEVRKSVRVYSKKDLTVDTLEAYKEQKKHFNFKSNLQTKSLSKFSGDPVLVDSIPGNIAAGQERRLLCAPRSRANSFTDIEDTCSHMKSIDVCVTTYVKDLKAHLENIRTHKYILFAFSQEQCTLFFAHEKTNEVCFLNLEDPDKEEIRKVLINEGIYSQEALGEISPYLRVFILSKLTSYHGKVEKLASREVNHICFITGAIFEAIRVAKVQKCPVSEVLFAWQHGFQRPIAEFHADERLYHLGLELLCKKNPKLHFLTKLSSDSNHKVA